MSSRASGKMYDFNSIDPQTKKTYRAKFKDEIQFLNMDQYNIGGLRDQYFGDGVASKAAGESGDQKAPLNAKQAQEMIDAMPDGPEKTVMQEALTGLNVEKPDEKPGEKPEEIEPKTQLPRSSPHDETKVQTLSESGKFETPRERGESMKEAKINKSVIASVISSVKDAFAGGDKGGKAIADYKAGLEKEWGSPIPKVLSGWIGQLYDAGETVLAEELYGVLALLSGDVEVAPPEVPVVEYKDFEKEHGYAPDELFSAEGLKDYDFPFEYLANKLREYEDAPNKDANDKKIIRILRKKIKAETGE